MIRINLFGPFAILDSRGRDVTPRSVKACALIALLACAPNGVRSRAWLKDHLWSTYAPDLAASSLRQAVYQLRLALGPDCAVLQADRLTIRLDQGSIDIPIAGEGEAFLEGFDCPDPEFEDWLLVERQKREKSCSPYVSAPEVRSTRRRNRIVICSPDPGLEPDCPTIGVVTDTFAGALAERALADVVIGEAQGVEADFVLELRHYPSARIVRAILLATRSNRHVWSDTLTLPLLSDRAGSVLGIARMVASGVDAVTAAMARGLPDASDEAVVLHRLVREIFTFNAERMRAANRELASLSTVLPSASGWHLFLQMILRVECAAPANAMFMEETAALMDRALQDDPGNAMVLSAAAHACIKVFNRPDDAVILARRAIERSWANPFAIDVLADALLMQGKAEQSYHLARRAQGIGQATSISHFFDMGLCLAAVASGRLAEALSLSRRAAALSPSFRPALRYSAILLAASGRFEEAGTMIGRLRTVEPDFELARLSEDPSYPVATIRRAGLLKAVTVASLGH